MNNLWRRNPSGRLRSGNFLQRFSGYGLEKIVQGFFEIAGIPIIVIQSYTRNKISAVIGMDISTVVFRSNENCDQWEARADGNGQVGVGLLVGNGGSINASQDVNFNVEDQELMNGDKVYPIDVFGHNSAGWSRRT